MPDERDVRAFIVKVSGDNDVEAKHDPPRSEGQITPVHIALDPLRQRTIEFFIDFLRDNRLVTRQEFEFLGENLYAVLFMDSKGETENTIGTALLKAVNEQTEARLRVELEFDPGQKLLASWPWEYLYCPLRKGIPSGYFLAEFVRLVLTRHLPIYGIPARHIRVDESELPLRILFVAASPEEEGLVPVQYERILEEIDQLEKSAPIKVSRLVQPGEPDLPPVATFENFYDMALSLKPHVIHFVGHGRCVDRGGQIAFVDSDHTADWVDDDKFANLLRQIHSVRLVFLQACESALPDPYQAISGVAMLLANANIPAVVAMQYRIEQMVATRFARRFYEALANNESIDAAVQMARSDIWVRVSDWDRSRTFGLPVLYQREPGALIASQRGAKTPSAPIATRGGADLSETLSSVSEVASSCPWCGASIDADEKFCGGCDGQLVCLVCNTRVTKKRSSCSQCGHSLRAPNQDVLEKRLPDYKYTETDRGTTL